MDRYVVWSDTGGLPLGHFDTEQLPLYPYAREHTLCDNFFTAAWGGSMLNHIWLIAAMTPLWPGAPADQIAQPIVRQRRSPHRVAARRKRHARRLLRQ